MTELDTTDRAALAPSPAREQAEVTDRSPWDWYAESCSCGQPPGGCRVHPRGRPSQRPPAGDWRVWAYVAGRGAGKTRAGACWVQHRVEHGTMKVGCLIAPTAADIRDVMVEGPSGLLAIAPTDGAGLAVLDATARTSGFRLTNPRPVAVSPGPGRARHHRAAAGLRQPDRSTRGARA